MRRVSPKIATMNRETATIGDVLGMVAMPMMREENTHIKQDAIEKRRPCGTQTPTMTFMRNR